MKCKIKTQVWTATTYKKLFMRTKAKVKWTMVPRRWPSIWTSSINVENMTPSRLVGHHHYCLQMNIEEKGWMKMQSTFYSELFEKRELRTIFLPLGNRSSNQECLLWQLLCKSNISQIMIEKTTSCIEGKTTHERLVAYIRSSSEASDNGL